MRIRKHARILAPSISTPPAVPNSPDTHDCQLNRSPWDVSAFTPEFEYQVKIEDENTCNIVGRESEYDPDSIGTSEEVEEEDYAPYVKKKGRKKFGGKRDINYVRCGKIDGKGWQCKKEAKEGELLCEHHILQLETYKHRYSYSYNTSRRAKTVASTNSKTVVTANKKRKRVRISSGSAMEFYYYSGFGPTYTLGRRRVRKNETVKEDEDIGDDQVASPSSASSDGVHDADGHGDNQVNNTEGRGLFYDEEESDDEQDECGDKKRVRKPIKERSLKSLF